MEFFRDLYSLTPSMNARSLTTRAWQLDYSIALACDSTSSASSHHIVPKEIKVLGGCPALEFSMTVFLPPFSPKPGQPLALAP